MVKHSLDAKVDIEKLELYNFRLLKAVNGPDYAIFKTYFSLSQFSLKLEIIRLLLNSTR